MIEFYLSATYYLVINQYYETKSTLWNCENMLIWNVAENKIASHSFLYSLLLLFKGKCSNYRLCDGVWTFFLENGTLFLENKSLYMTKVKIVAVDAKVRRIVSIVQAWHRCTGCLLLLLLLFLYSFTFPVDQATVVPPPPVSLYFWM